MKIVEVSSTIASRPTFCQVSILNDDKYPGTVRTFQRAEKGSWAEAYTDTMAPIIDFVKWQWSARPEEHCLWLLNKFAKGCINCMVMPQLFIEFIDAIRLFDVIAGGSRVIPPLRMATPVYWFVCEQCPCSAI